jgi:hypothetical protein
MTRINNARRAAQSNLDLLTPVKTVLQSHRAEAGQPIMSRFQSLVRSLMNAHQARSLMDHHGLAYVTENDRFLPPQVLSYHLYTIVVNPN